jgi:hypothetical protein
MLALVAVQFMFGVDTCLASILAIHVVSAVCAVDFDRCRIYVHDAARFDREATILGTGTTRAFYFALQQLSVLGGVTSLSPRSCRCPSLTMSNSCDV